MIRAQSNLSDDGYGPSDENKILTNETVPPMWSPLNGPVLRNVAFAVCWET